MLAVRGADPVSRPPGRSRTEAAPRPARRLVHGHCPLPPSDGAVGHSRSRSASRVWRPVSALSVGCRAGSSPPSRSPVRSSGWGASRAGCTPPRWSRPPTARIEVLRRSEEAQAAARAAGSGGASARRQAPPGLRAESEKVPLRNAGTRSPDRMPELRRRLRGRCPGPLDDGASINWRETCYRVSPGSPNLAIWLGYQDSNLTDEPESGVLPLHHTPIDVPAEAEAPRNYSTVARGRQNRPVRPAPQNRVASTDDPLPSHGPPLSRPCCCSLASAASGLYSWEDSGAD